MDKNFIQEAFKQVYLTEDAEEFSLNVSGPDDTESFMDIVNSDEYADDEMISDVYDLEAEAKEDLKQSYIGKVILDCNVCHSNVFFNKDEITENEDGVCCEEIECPYCMSNEGYTIIGEVKPYQEEEDVDIDDIESAEIPEEEPETEEATDDIDVEEPEEDEDLEEGLKADEVKELRGDEEINGADGPIAAVDELEGCDDIRGPKYKELNEENGSFKKYVVITKGGLGHDADSLNGRLFDSKEEAAEACKKWKNSYNKKDKKIFKPETSIYTYKPGGPFDDAVKANEKNKGLNECGYPQKLEECGDSEAMEEGIEGTIGGKLAGKAVGTAIGGPVGGAVGSFVGGKIGDKIQDTFSEGCEDKKELEEGWMPINKVSRYFQVADEYQVNDKLEARNAKTGKMLQWGTNNGGYNDDRISVKTKDGKYTSVAKETLKSEIDNLKGENLGKSPFTIDECGDPEKLDECGGGDAELVEGIEDVSISTEDENITMTTKEDGGVVVETSPKEEFEDTSDEEFSGDEMIAPLEPETESDVEDAIEVNTEDKEVPEDEVFDEISDEDMNEEGEEESAPEDEFEEFDEESFNGLGESYLKRCYENVTSFKTSNITLNENKEFIIEGKIGFDSGNKKDTQFVFSTKSNENGKLKLEGYNKQISKGKKTFKLNCSVNGKSLICESLNYNYKGKNDLNESVRVYGTVKRK